MANILSAAVCVGVLFLVVYLRRQFPELRYTLRPYAGPLQIAAFVGSIVLFVLSFIRPRKQTVH